ncbi:hypothetical protein SPRG_17141, partial [Saprolegnia parasitica CBS 223.65]
RQLLGVQHNFASLTQIADDVRSIRNTIQALVLAFEDAEQHLILLDAHFASQQQTELEQYEHTLLVQKDIRTRQRQEERRRALGDAFEKDLKTYQALITYQGHAPTRPKAAY